jgi:hypothetical protein
VIFGTGKAFNKRCKIIEEKSKAAPFEEANPKGMRHPIQSLPHQPFEEPNPTQEGLIALGVVHPPLLPLRTG